MTRFKSICLMLAALFVSMGVLKAADAPLWMGPLVGALIGAGWPWPAAGRGPA